MQSPKPAPSLVEFIVLTALMISLVALTTDIMLPALDVIATDLGHPDPLEGHLIISVMFAGFAVGQLLVGPLSDSYGRKPVVHASYVVFCAGTLLCLLTRSFELMLAGRLLQGLGMSGPRIIAVAIVRDRHAGRRMARIMSFVMAVFILVPAVAPSLGQVLIAFSDWRATFTLLLVMACVTWGWFALRQVETLPKEARRPLSARNLLAGIREILTTPAAIGYTVCTGLIFGPFIAYLSLAQQIFQRTYDTGLNFTLWFAAGALSIGVAAIVNSALVERLGMRFLSNLALGGAVLGGTAFGALALATDGLPPFGLFMLWLICNFFFMGLLFGNLNALAMEPLGHIAGLGAAVVGALSTGIAIPVGTLISENYTGNLALLTLAFATSATVCLVLGWLINRR
ncbi:Bicyclomycin resistance protein [Sulfitobacter sp. THAF37]|uniref:multidrug effflux MFS transporter n=1 Tax=Sulfitobacter sp. THAF37 TaxID=2587855 RepID=UPI0012680E77|nr:multidrug effflux MFS transporter [Sulfitobacter sp. THAF37]QFT59807.1 Bicyclomycin resistance protein [Sulfitobacter sp. THAF37]